MGFAQSGVFLTIEPMNADSSPNYAPGDSVCHKTLRRRMVVTGARVVQYSAGPRMVVWCEWTTEDGTTRKGQFGADSLEPW